MPIAHASAVACGRFAWISGRSSARLEARDVEVSGWFDRLLCGAQPVAKDW